jgi:hypothetical protein
LALANVVLARPERGLGALRTLRSLELRDCCAFGEWAGWGGGC